MARILVVEDDEANQELVTRFLERDGHAVLLAVDGLGGVRTAQVERPDLIVMDLGLPGMDGWKAIRWLKRGMDTSHIPIVALTAHTTAEDVLKAKEAGCDAYETKPIVYRRLMTKIRELVER